ncbi:MAG TPA: YncE family protein [Candidatus Sulfotelmatobacter sp.]
MSFRRAGQFAATVLATLISLSCGEVYRPVVIPTQLTPPNPGSFHEVFVINATVPSFPGTAMQIDVSGDSVVAATPNGPAEPNIGTNPTHGAILPNNSRIFVASAGSLNSGGADLVASFTPAFDSTTATGFGTVSTFTLPSGSLPVFVHTTQNNAVYVANYGTNSVSVLNPILSVVSNTAAVGAQPVALAETPDATKLYVANQADSTVTSLSTIDMSTFTTLPVGTSPVWAVSRGDGQRVYVVTQGDGNLYTIQTSDDTLIGTPQSVGGPGANYAFYDSGRNRLYVINPATPRVFIFDATTDPPTPLGGASGISIPAPAGVSGVGQVIPVAITALPDGSRFYVASYLVAAGACPDANTAVTQCIVPQVTVFDAKSLTVKTAIFPLLAPTASGTQVQPYAVAPVAYCAPVTPYAPSAARFRMSATASVDSSRVYVGICDGGTIAVINTTTSTLSAGGSNSTDNLVMDLNAPFSVGTAGSNGQPPLQNPILLFPGQ